MSETREYAARLYALAKEMRDEEGCVTESPDLVEAAADRLDAQTVTINVLRRQRDELLSALVAMVQEPQPLGIDRDSYQTALALVIKHHDNVDNPEAWAARKASA